MRGTSVINDHKLGALKQQKFILSHFWRGLKSRRWEVSFLLKIWGRILPCLLQLPEVPRISSLELHHSSLCSTFAWLFLCACLYVWYFWDGVWAP